jgi:two-component system, LytTR family, response regulator
LNLNCLIVDDEPLARNLLTEYVKKISYLTLVKACSGALEAMEVLRSQPVDLMFLDIQMPEVTGINFLKTLQKKPMVVLTTAYSEYALESYELDVVDYLLKPITLERFLRAVEKASERLSEAPAPVLSVPKPEANQPFVFVKDGTKLIKIRWDDILYVEGLKDYVTIHTRQQKVISLQRLKTMEESLPADKFIRIHNSYIIALQAIDTIHKDKVQVGSTFLPVSDSYRKSFKEFIEKNHMQ